MTDAEKRLHRILILLAVLTMLFPLAGEAQTKAESPAKAPAAGPALSLDDYLKQVAEKNDAFRSSQLLEEGANLRSGEGTLLTKPALIASAQYAVDKREQSAAAITGSETKVQAYSLGIQQQTDFGLQGKLLYNLTGTSIVGANPAFLPNSEFFVAGPVLELTQSFGKNGFGRETRAQKEAAIAAAQATMYAERFRKTALRAEAESAFWRMALAREGVEATKGNLERAKRIQGWSSNRARMQLGDRADSLQADAAVYSRELEVQAALDEEKAASRNFNTFRGLDSDEVSEALPILDRDLIQGLKAPNRTDLRDDVKAAGERKKAAEASAILGQEKNRPTVDAFASLGLNGRDPATGTTVSESFTSDHPNYAVGVRMTMPLDLGTLSRDREGYEKEKLAAEVGYRRTVFEQDRLWNDLNKRFAESQERLKLARKIETAQREKLDYERDRQRRGRSTTYQVILFEQDFASAQLARIRTQAEVLNIFAQLKTFGGGQ